MHTGTTKILLTGSGGTIGQGLSDFLRKQNMEVIVWNRKEISVDNYASMEKFISLINPDVLIHLAAVTSFDPELRKQSWLINYEWPSELAWICKIHQIKFIFTSTAMVFSPNNNLKTGVSSIDIEGQSEPEVQLFINNELVLLDEDGKFITNVALSLGLNNLEINAKKKHSKTRTIYLNILREENVGFGQIN